MEVLGLKFSFVFGCREVSLAELSSQRLSICQNSLLGLMELHEVKSVLVAAWLLQKAPKAKTK